MSGTSPPQIPEKPAIFQIPEDWAKYLQEQCSEMKYGKCYTVGCLKRGGYRRENGSPGNVQPTCIELEIMHALLDYEKLSQWVLAAYEGLVDFEEFFDDRADLEDIPDTYNESRPNREARHLQTVLNLLQHLKILTSTSTSKES